LFIFSILPILPYLHDDDQMISKPIRPLFLAILFVTVALFVMQLLQAELVFHHQLITKGQWWRIIGGNFVHANIPHLLLNISGLWIMGFLFIDSLSAKTFIISTLIMSIFVGAGLFYFDPDLQKYYGYSGVLYGLFLLGGVTAILSKDYFTGISVIVFILGKLIWDLINGGSASSEELIGIPVAVNAHLYGISGAIVISAFLFFTHKEND